VKGLTRRAWWLLPTVASLTAIAVGLAAADLSSWVAWVAVVVLTAITAVIGRALTAGSETTGAPELTREGNARFDFWFSYPRGWARADPENDDGNRYVDPANVEVSVAFWGSHNLYGASALENHRRWAEADGTVLDSREAGGRRRWKTDQGYGYEQVPGWRVITLAPSTDGVGVTHFQQYVDAGDRIIGFHAKAPTPVYSSYLSLFLRLVDQIAINRDGRGPG
jgi:hypothetical protein